MKSRAVVGIFDLESCDTEIPHDVDVVHICRSTLSRNTLSF